MIDTVALRIKTLKQAMSGKLSEQKSEDGEAIPEGIVASDSSTDENAYAIPTSWRWVRVKDVVAKDVGGGTPSKAVPEYWNNGDISWATVKDFSNSENGYINETIDHITQEGLENSSANMVDEEAIVVCMRMALGKIVRVAKPMAINQDLRALWLKSFVEQDYFVYFYKTLKVEGRGTTVAGIKKDELMNYAFPVPPIKEQRRIIEKVNSIFEQLDIIDNLQLQYASDLEVLKSKIIDAGIQGKLTEQLPEDGTAEELLEQITEEKKALEDAGVYKNKKKVTIKNAILKDDIFEIPKTWKWVRLGQLADVYGRIGFRGYTKADLVEAGQGAISMSPSNITFSGKVVFENNTYITWEKYNESPEIKVREGDVLIVKTGSSYGKTAIIEEMPEKCTINPQLAILKNILCDRYYLNLYMKSSHAWNQYNSFVVGAATPTFSQEKLANMLIPLPPLNEQERIVSKINEILELF